MRKGSGIKVFQNLDTFKNLLIFLQYSLEVIVTHWKMMLQILIVLMFQIFNRQCVGAKVTELKDGPDSWDHLCEDLSVICT